MDKALGKERSQECTIPSGSGILIPIWTGECNRAVAGHSTDSFQDLSKCAREFDKGSVSGKVIVDGQVVANMDNQYNTMNNVTELYTRMFNVTIPDESHLIAEAHVWFVFLKPLSSRDHTVYYQNDVGCTTGEPEC